MRLLSPGCYREVVIVKLLSRGCYREVVIVRLLGCYRREVVLS